MFTLILSILFWIFPNNKNLGIVTKVFSYITLANSFIIGFLGAGVFTEFTVYNATVQGIVCCTPALALVIINNTVYSKHKKNYE